MDAITVSLLIVIAVQVVLFISITVLFFRALERSQIHADNVHSRSQSHMDSVLDRLMAVDFSTFKAYQSAEQADVGGYTPPDPDAAADNTEPWTTTDTETEELGREFSLTGRDLRGLSDENR